MVATRASLRQRTAKIAQEFAIAVTLCAIAIATAGGVTDISMRVGLLVAAVYLMAAEVYRQMPELARHATAPFRRLLTERTEANEVEASSYSRDVSELRLVTEAMAAAARDTSQAYADAAQMLVRNAAELSRAVNALAATRDQVSANTDKIIERVTSEWRRAVDDNNQMIARVMQETLSIHDHRLRDAVAKLDRIASQLESLAIPPAAPGTTPNDATPVTSVNVEVAVYRAMTEVLSKLVAPTDTRRRGFELAADYEDLQRETRTIHSVSLLVNDPFRAWAFYRELGLPPHLRELELFRSVRSDPEMLTRLIDVLVARIEQLRR